jgi:hypothetical protein
MLSDKSAVVFIVSNRAVFAFRCPHLSSTYSHSATLLSTFSPGFSFQREEKACVVHVARVSRSPFCSASFAMVVFRRQLAAVARPAAQRISATKRICRQMVYGRERHLEVADGWPGSGFSTPIIWGGHHSP